MSRFPVQVAGVDLEIESRGWRRPRLLRDGEEVPRDRWENYVVTDAQGREHRPQVSYNSMHMSPMIHDGDERTATVVAPLPKQVLVSFIALLVLGLVFGGVLGIVLVSVAERLSVSLWRRRERSAGKVVAMGLFWMLLLGLAVLQVVRLMAQS